MGVLMSEESHARSRKAFSKAQRQLEIGALLFSLVDLVRRAGLATEPHCAHRGTSAAALHGHRAG